MNKSMHTSWINLFTSGKWKDCAAIITSELNTLSTHENQNNYHLQRMYCANNLFVCNQLAADWESGNEDHIASEWSKSYSVIHQAHHVMRCQNICTEVPLDLVLCMTCNFLWWTLMKVDPLDQHSCQKESIKAALYSLRNVSKKLQVWNAEYQATGCIETDFIQAIKTNLPCLLKLTLIQSQLVTEVITLGFLIMLDDHKNLSQNASRELLNVMDQLVDMLPLLKVHFSKGRMDASENKYECLLKFGWHHEIGQILNAASKFTISEIILIITAVFLIRVHSITVKENCTKAAKYLNLIEKENLSFPFLYHYVLALVNFQAGDHSTSLYHLQHSSMCESNAFMQGRFNTLKGQILLLEDKPSAAVDVLQSVQYKRKEVRIPLCAFLIGKAYGMLGRVKDQAEILNLLLECLSTEPVVQPKLVSPLVGMEHRLLLSVHIQPEITYQEVLRASAVAYLSFQPKKAAEKLLMLLNVMSAELNDNGDPESLWELSELLHDASSALLEANSVHEAQEVCEAALQFHSRSFRQAPTAGFGLLEEDIIALLLLAEVKEQQGSYDVPDILNRCAKLLQSFLESLSNSKQKQEETVSLSKALLARVYLHKAMLNARRKFDEDAVACFQRALHWKRDDPEVILRFAHHLLESNQIEESLALWQMYEDCKGSSLKINNFTLNRLLGQRISDNEKKKIVCRLKALSHS